ncbi:hypothetical protein PN836_001360 [Ningiella sp. W23]|uniref:hypothetical protein n=1 Tax=Ningiella sp. W23 TaxID=3023715 RepID=UPI0037582F50
MTKLALLPGEMPMANAPEIQLDDGTNCIPQHYLSYQHTLESVSDIISDIDYDPNYILFADQDHAGIFLQVGIVGLDNYVSAHKQAHKKIVYGRRWRVEPNLPSSEIIQTAFLAMLKAREHEVRELFKWHHKNSITTPFSCHHDLPLMAMSSHTQTQKPSDAELSRIDVDHLFNSIRYDHCRFELKDMIEVGEQHHVLALQVLPDKSTRLHELKPQTLCLVCESLKQDLILYSLMDMLISLSNRHVEEHFSFKSYARFSRANGIEKISALSAKTRMREQSSHNNSEVFDSVFSSNNYETDSSRVPRIYNGKLGDKINQQLSQLSVGEGILPKQQ